MSMIKTKEWWADWEWDRYSDWRRFIAPLEYEYWQQTMLRVYEQSREWCETFPKKWRNERRRGYLEDRKSEEQAWIDRWLELMGIYKDETSQYFCQKETQAAIKRIKSLARQIEWIDKPQKDQITEEDMIHARAVDIKSLGLIKDLKPIQGRAVGKCLWHEESTASLMVYPGAKGFHCFGCQKGGTAIDVVMKVEGLKFIPAVKYLQGR